MISDVLQNKWVRAVALLGALIGIAIVGYLLSAVLVPLFLAFIVAYIFDPVIDKIETYKISRVGAIVTLVGGILLAAIIFPLVILSSVSRQADEMMDPATTVKMTRDEEDEEALRFRTKVANTVEDWFALDSLVQALGWDEDTSLPMVASTTASESDAPANSTEEPPSSSTDAEAAADAPEESGAASQDLDSLGIIRQKIGEKITQNTDQLIQSFFPEWKTASTSALRMMRALGDMFLSTFLFVGNFVLFAFVAIYLLKDYDHIVAHGDSLVPHRYRLKVRDIMGRIDRQLRSFLRGQFMVCCCLGTMYAIGLSISGAPFALVLALFGAVASFVPYLGIVLTIGPAVILTIFYYSGIDWHLAGVLITFVVAQFLEGNFLTPKIVGSQVGLGPVWVILAIMIFSSTLGFIGLLLAVPIAAVLKVLAEEGLRLYRESEFYSADGAG